MTRHYPPLLCPFELLLY